MLREGILQNSLESPRFWGLHMEVKSLHMADFGLRMIFLGYVLVYTLFAYSKNYQSNAMKLSKNNVVINVSKL